MPVELIGWIAPRVSSEMIPPSGPPFDVAVIAETARIHEQAGFDRVLIGYFSHAPDGFLIGAHAAAVTSRLQLLLAHRPGFVAPTVAARKLATLDQLSGGRTAVHMIAGGNDMEQARDGDFTDHDARYRRTQEYVTLLKRTWTATAARGCRRTSCRPSATTSVPTRTSAPIAPGLSTRSGRRQKAVRVQGPPAARRTRRPRPRDGHGHVRLLFVALSLAHALLPKLGLGRRGARRLRSKPPQRIPTS